MTSLRSYAAQISRQRFDSPGSVCECRIKLRHRLLCPSKGPPRGASVGGLRSVVCEFWFARNSMVATPLWEHQDGGSCGRTLVTRSGRASSTGARHHQDSDTACLHVLDAGITEQVEQPFRIFSAPQVICRCPGQVAIQKFKHVCWILLLIWALTHFLIKTLELLLKSQLKDAKDMASETQSKLLNLIFEIALQRQTFLEFVLP